MHQSKFYQFNELTTAQLYDILELRERVFTIGQRCTDCDIDGVDKTAMHYAMYDQDNLIAYLRVYTKENKLNLGRIIVHPEHQGKGLGRIMMVEVMEHLRSSYPDKSLAMSAQYYLEKFYQSLGFVTTSEIYLEGGIEHVNMNLDA